MCVLEQELHGTGVCLYCFSMTRKFMVWFLISAYAILMVFFSQLLLDHCFQLQYGRMAGLDSMGCMKIIIFVLVLYLFVCLIHR